MTSSAHWEGTDLQCNYTLMRCAPLGIYGYQLKDMELRSMAHQDSALSLPNQDVCDAVACYVIAIAELIKTGNNMKAFRRAMTWINQYGKTDTVKLWIQEAEENRKESYLNFPNHVKVGFTHAFRHLHLGTPYMDAIKETIEGGGNPGTNACIVGGLMGAYWGIDGIPQNIRNVVLQGNTKKGYERPDFVNPNQIEQLVEKLYILAPKPR